MPLNFPDTPSANQVYTSGSNSWQWDGTVWNAISSSIVTSTYGPTGPTGATGAFNTTTQTIDFSSAVNRLSLTVTGLTSSNQVYAFDRMAGITAYLQNASGSISVVGTVESSQTYRAAGSTLTNTRSADVVVKPSFTQGLTSYTAEDMLGLTLVYFGTTNLFTRRDFSSIPNDGGFTSSTFTLGSTFGFTGLTLNHAEESYVVSTITGLTWVAADSFITCKVLGLTTENHDPEDAILEGVRFEINNIVAGTGFDIIGHAPEGTYGKYKVKCISL